MILTVALLVLGLLLLVAGGEILVRGGSGLGRALGLSPLVVGLTVVAFATSAPELAVSVGATFSGVRDWSSATSSAATSPTSCWCSAWQRSSCP